MTNQCERDMLQGGRQYPRIRHAGVWWSKKLPPARRIMGVSENDLVGAGALRCVRRELLPPVSTLGAGPEIECEAVHTSRILRSRGGIRASTAPHSPRSC